MKIGIIGTGNMGRTLGLRWVDFIRFHIATMGRGPLTTISLGSAGEPAAP